MEDTESADRLVKHIYRGPGEPMTEEGAASAAAHPAPQRGSPPLSRPMGPAAGHLPVRAGSVKQSRLESSSTSIPSMREPAGL